MISKEEKLEFVERVRPGVLTIVDDVLSLFLDKTRMLYEIAGEKEGIGKERGRELFDERMSAIPSGELRAELAYLMVSNSQNPKANLEKLMEFFFDWGKYEEDIRSVRIDFLRN